MIHVHQLDGCAPTPLARYLKALGILRLIAEQGDSNARGWWDGDRFRLATALDRSELRTFFLDRFRPTPLFNPWGARSGFYPGSSEKTARQVLDAISKTSHQRFEAYRQTINAVRATITEVCGNSKPKDEDKPRLILALRRNIRGASEDWLDAVTAVIGSGNEIHVAQPPIFGTGGSEGSGSYTSGYMSAIDQCLLRRAWDHAIDNALFGSADLPNCDWDQTLGQFSPDAPATPWDFLLAFEGGCIARTVVTSRNTSGSNRWASSPFYMAPTSYGYPSEGRLDEYVLNKGKELPGRGEQWFPLWSHPSRLAEVQQVFHEGRANTRKGRAEDGWSMLRAVKSLGVNRGIRSFIRYGYQQRNNLATHFAVPIGRFLVEDRGAPQLACLDDLDAWLPRLRREARDAHAPARLAQAERRLGDALFAVTQHPEEPGRWQSVLLALAAVEAVQVSGSGFGPGPIPPLRPAWVQAADDGSQEVRLALSFALQQGDFEGANLRWWSSIRRHWLPLDPKRPWQYAKSGSIGHARLQRGPEVVMAGRIGIDDAVALVDRRLTEAAQRGGRRLPLQASRQTAAQPADLAQVVAGGVDLDKTLGLARGFMALKVREWQRAPQPPSPATPGEDPDDAWLAVRLALLPWPLNDPQGAEIRIPTDPAIFRRLANGDAATAVDLALRRLGTAGIRTAVRVAAVPTQTARLWAAALAFPISRPTAWRFVRRLDPSKED